MGWGFCEDFGTPRICRTKWKIGNFGKLGDTASIGSSNNAATQYNWSVFESVEILDPNDAEAFVVVTVDMMSFRYLRHGHGP
jgi:hypothetical protein